MGGGYDPSAEDASPAGATTSAEAFTSSTCAPVRGWAGLRRTTACRPTYRLSTLTATDSSIASMWSMSRAQLYRIDIEDADGAAAACVAWHITKLAALNDGTGGTDGTRKVYFAPDVVLTRNYSAHLVRYRRPREAPDRYDQRSLFPDQGHACRKGEPPSVTLITEAALTDDRSRRCDHRRAGVFVLAGYQWRKSHQPADHLWRHHLFLDQSPVAAGGGKLLTQPIARISAAAGMQGADISQSCRRRPAAIAGRGLRRCGWRQAGAVCHRRRRRDELVDRSRACASSRSRPSASARSGSWRTEIAKSSRQPKATTSARS